MYNIQVMDNRAIGIFDSGLGGLTALSALRNLLPGENIIYFGDTARCPYGTRSREELFRFAGENLEFLASKGVKAVIAACGTVSANAPDVLHSFRLPVVNVIDPVVERIGALQEESPVAVIATDASIRNGAFQRKLTESCPGREILAIPCQNFVHLCETGHIFPDDPLLIKTVEEYLHPVREAGASALILGCTHFGIISSAISAYLGEKVRLFSASECAAAAMKKILEEKELTADSPQGTVVYYTSGSAEEFEKLAGVILNTKIKAVHID